MRRAIAILMAVMLVMVVTSGSAVTRKEYYEDVSEQTKGILQGIVELYGEYPEAFDADYIMLSYGYLTTYMALQRVNTIEMMYELKQEGHEVVREFANGTQMIQEYGNSMIEKVLSEKFGEWTSGKTADADFAEYVMKMINVYIKDYEVE